MFITVLKSTLRIYCSSQWLFITVYHKYQQNSTANIVRKRFRKSIDLRQKMVYNKYSHNLLFGKVGYYEIKTAG